MDPQVSAVMVTQLTPAPCNSKFHLLCCQTLACYLSGTIRTRGAVGQQKGAIMLT